MPRSNIRSISFFVGSTIVLSLLVSWEQTKQLQSISDESLLSKLAALHSRVEELEEKNENLVKELGTLHQGLQESKSNKTDRLLLLLRGFPFASANNTTAGSSEALAVEKADSIINNNNKTLITFNASGVYPISFGLPEGRFSRIKQTHLAVLKKTRDFARIIPRVKETYVYKTESSYYDGYSEAYFGITFKKAGWDCFRHYEIIASGSIPFFLNISNLPHYTMADFPVDLVKEAMQLPGVPTEAEVQKHIIQSRSTDALHINHAIFDNSKYNELLQKIRDYSLRHLTWSAKVNYIFANVQRHYPCLQNPKVLFVSSKTCEYMSCTVFGGLYETLGHDNMSSLTGPKHELFTTLKGNNNNNNSYGGGYSYTHVFEDAWNKTEVNRITNQRLQEGFFNIIIVANFANHGCDLLKFYGKKKSEILVKYQQEFNPLVITIDGSDEFGCHSFFAKPEGYPFKHHMQFVREFHRYKGKVNPPKPWTGCQE